MKVDVITVEKATFKSFRWWSNWIDVCVYDYYSAPYLLQMQVSRTNKKRFNNTRITGGFMLRLAKAESIGDLTQMEREK